MRSANISVLQSALTAVNNFRSQIDQQAGIGLDSLSIKLDGGGMIVLTWREDLGETGDWDVTIQ